jgi:hypothetical protein
MQQAVTLAQTSYVQAGKSQRRARERANDVAAPKRRKRAPSNVGNWQRIVDWLGQVQKCHLCSFAS